MNRRRFAAPCLLTLALTGCTEPLELETEGSTTNGPATSDATSNSTTPTNPPDGTDTVADSTGSATDTVGPMPTERQVDILFVIDNSGSMGEEQATLTANINALFNILDNAPLAVDYRIGVTTTDDGNPWCQGTGPESGTLRATSCRSRPTEFIFEGAQVIDATQEACLDVCSLEEFVIDDGNPWVDINHSTGTSNVTQQDPREAIRCMLPQGINGCGFESQMESTWKALRRFETNGDPSFGFHRPGALLSVVLVTDETECSSNNEWETIWLPDGDKVFWSDPNSPAPSSAVCWNAGVVCTGGGGGVYDDCVPVNLDALGNEVTDDQADDQAVLYPIDRYVTALAEVGAHMVAINGVNSDGTVTYADSLMDPQFQNDFGIGPGCESAAGRAVPPVRVRHILQEINGTERSMFSICEADFSPAFTAIAEGILARLP